jgi:hypothetical protein
MTYRQIRVSEGDKKPIKPDPDLIQSGRRGRDVDADGWNKKMPPANQPNRYSEPKPVKKQEKETKRSSER